MEKKEKSSFWKWVELTQSYAKDCRSFFAKKLGMVNPDKKSEYAALSDFETCDELTFESIVTWITQNQTKVEGATSALVRKENLDQSKEDFAYKIEIFFMKDNQVQISALHKVVFCNVLEDDLAVNFEEVNGQHLFILK